MKIAMMVRGFLQTPVPNDIAYSPAKVAQAVAEGLAGKGHDVTFFGPEGTDIATSVETASIRPFFTTMSDFDKQVSTTDLFSNYRFGLADIAMAREMLNKARDGEFDCAIFNHFESAMALAPLYPEIPIIHILHDEMNEARKEMIELHSSPNQYFISISDNQRRDMPDLNYAGTVYNGIEPDDFPFSDESEDYLMFSGRIMQAKGVREAVQVAIQSKHRLLIAGNLSKQDYWYFDEHIKPFLDDKILFLGMLDRDQLVKYYQKAKAVLVPIQWEEPFGLTMIEANACGAPVIAFRRGSVPEIIKDGKTGYIVDNSAEMIMAIEKINKLKRRDCHDHVKKHFSRDLMVKNYEKVIEGVIAHHEKFPRKKLSHMSAYDVSNSLSRFSKRLVKKTKSTRKKPTKK